MSLWIARRVGLLLGSWLLVGATAAHASTLDGGCALTPEGGVQCWGDNQSGQLGDGSQRSSGSPVPVVGLASGVNSVATSGTHACALTAAGAVLCWGSNGVGDLGIGSTGGFSSVPVPVVGLSTGVAAISNSGHTCALTTAGGVVCWGANFRGQLGDGTVIDRNAPVPVSGLSSGIQAIGTGSSFSCAVTAAGAVLCWGHNDSGQTGNGTTTPSNVLLPTPVSGLTSGVTALSLGIYHGCALTSAGAVRCWGGNGSGQVGNGTTTGSALPPTQVVGLASGVTAISAGAGHSCALTTSGLVRCWGANHLGQLGDGTQFTRPAPVAVSGLAGGIEAITAFGHYSCARAASGIQCWGINDYGQLGNGIPMHSLVPLPVAGLAAPVATIDAGFHHSCVRTTVGSVQCWGSGWWAQLGNSSLSNSRLPVFGIYNGIAGSATGGLHSCAVTTAGGVSCWGHNADRQLGLGDTNTRLSPWPIPGFTGVAEVALGGFHSCARTTAGAALCWGRNTSGQGGDGTTSTKGGPTPVSGLSSGVAALALGDEHSCALTTGGGVLCWGSNGSGQLGTGNTTPSSVPVPVSGLASGVAAITAGDLHTCALTTGGAALCWGSNTMGQLGDASETPSSLPVAVSGLSSGVASLNAGLAHTCAVTTGGALRCWGRNDYGQLGDGSVDARNVPVPVVGLASGVVQSAAGNLHTCAALSDGSARCWGDHAMAQLGEGSPMQSLLPVDVLPFVAPIPALGATGLVLLAGALLASVASRRRRSV